jgi:hypothetical protein
MMYQLFASCCQSIGCEFCGADSSFLLPLRSTVAACALETRQVLGSKVVTGFVTGLGEGGAEEITAVQALDKATGEMKAASSQQIVPRFDEASNRIQLQEIANQSAMPCHDGLVPCHAMEKQLQTGSCSCDLVHN